MSTPDKEQCNFCGNTTFSAKAAAYMYSHNGQYLLVQDVPANECTFCGERYYRAEVLKRIEAEFDQVYTSGKKVPSTMTVPVESWASVA